VLNTPTLTRRFDPAHQICAGGAFEFDRKTVRLQDVDRPAAVGDHGADPQASHIAHQVGAAAVHHGIGAAISRRVTLGASSDSPESRREAGSTYSYAARVSITDPALASLATLLVLYAVVVIVFIAVGRRSEARALARFIPDCLVLLRRLVTDDRVPRSRKLALVFLLGYLALPIDLIPDFIPVAGQLDDAILAAVVLRFVLRGGGPALVDEHWPGPPEGARVIKRLGFGAQPSASLPSRMP
jgi:uncharacterized membrane protein YkvA (DUF1232 family)